MQRYSDDEFYKAILSGNVEIVESKLMDERLKGRDPSSLLNNSKDFPLPPLFAAVQHSQLRMVKLFLSMPGVDINICLPKIGTVLMYAIIKNHLEKNNVAIIKLLLSHSTTNVNTLNGDGWTALHLAIVNQQDNIVELLLEKAEIDLTVGIAGMSTLKDLVLSHGSSGTQRLILSRLPESTNKSEHSSNANIYNDKSDVDMTPLMLALMAYSLKDFAVIFLNNPSEIYTKNKYGVDVLSMALSIDDEALILGILKFLTVQQAMMNKEIISIDRINQLRDEAENLGKIELAYGISMLSQALQLIKDKKQLDTDQREPVPVQSETVLSRFRTSARPLDRLGTLFSPGQLCLDPYNPSRPVDKSDSNDLSPLRRSL